eukprot:729675-Pleurochrysis_carterae.AAC.3
MEYLHAASFRHWSVLRARRRVPFRTHFSVTQSRDAPSRAHQAERLVERGVRELNLIAEDTNQYGRRALLLYTRPNGAAFTSTAAHRALLGPSFGHSLWRTWTRHVAVKRGAQRVREPPLVRRVSVARSLVFPFSSPFFNSLHVPGPQTLVFDPQTLLVGPETHFLFWKPLATRATVRPCAPARSDFGPDDTRRLPALLHALAVSRSVLHPRTPATSSRRHHLSYPLWFISSILADSLSLSLALAPSSHTPASRYRRAQSLTNSLAKQEYSQTRIMYERGRNEEYGQTPRAIEVESWPAPEAGLRWALRLLLSIERRSTRAPRLDVAQALPKLRWIRLLYCYPSYFSEELIQTIASVDKAPSRTCTASRTHSSRANASRANASRANASRANASRANASRASASRANVSRSSGSDSLKQ